MMFVLRRWSLFRLAVFSSPRLFICLIISAAAVASLVLVAANCHSQAHSLAFSDNRSGSLQSLNSASNRATPAADKTATESAPTKSAHSQASSAPSASPSPDVKPSTPAAALSCGLDLDALSKQYNSDLQSAKDDLDKKLSFPTGMNISSQYVDTYNQKVTDLYNQYATKAKTAGCSYELPRPAFLPSTYVGL